MTLAGQKLEFYEDVAKLSFLLGGIGNRSRRGFGSIRLCKECLCHADIFELRHETLNSLNTLGHNNQFKLEDIKLTSENGSTCVAKVIASQVSTFPCYPAIWRIYFGKPASKFDSLLEKIGQATHDHNPDGNEALGYAKGPKRLASPVHATINKVQGGYVPVITQLYTNDKCQQSRQEGLYL